MENRKIGISKAEVDATKIVEDSAEFLVVPAILAREGVYPYPEGKAYKPAAELKDATWTGERAWVLAEKHPDTVFLMDRDLIIGQTEGVKFCDKINGIIGNLRFKKAACDATFLDNIKTGKVKDVSLGFFYIEDRTPGEFKGQKYDFVQRKLLIDHVAAGVPIGRCSSPYCGIAVDSILKVAADPVEETKDHIRIRAKDPGDFVEGSFRTITLSESEGIQAVIGKLKSDPQGSTHVQVYLFAKVKDWTIQKAEAWVAQHKGSADAVWDTQYIDDLSDDCFAYVESGGKKDEQGKTVPRSLRHLPFKDAQGKIDHDHLVNALARVKQSGTMPEGGKIEATSKLCSAVRAWNKEHQDSKIESDVCGTAPSADAFCEIERSRKLLSK